MSAKYNFDENLLKASESDVLEDAKQEWELLCSDKRENQDGQCICQRKVKCINYMFNPKTNNTIIVGTTCHKKFGLKKDSANKHIQNIYKLFLEKGHYKIIDNVVVYTQNIEENLIKYCVDKYKNYESSYDFDGILNLKKCLDVLTKKYTLSQLNTLQKDINDKIKKRDLEKENLLNEINKIKEYENLTLKCFSFLGQNLSRNDYNCYHFDNLDECRDFINNLPPMGIRYYTDRGVYKYSTLYCVELTCDGESMGGLNMPPTCTKCAEMCRNGDNIHGKFVCKTCLTPKCPKCNSLCYDVTEPSELTCLTCISNNKFKKQWNKGLVEKLKLYGIFKLKLLAKKKKIKHSSSIDKIKLVELLSPIVEESDFPIRL